jgi:CheY-like chemotaxis protein
MASVDLKGSLVLVVEDHPANMLLTQAILQRAGMRTAPARSAEEAMSWLRGNAPDIILMDIQLPGQDGLSLTNALKTAPETAGIPIIALTAHAMKGDQARIAEAGCDGYIAKPINTRTFVEEMTTILQRLHERVAQGT